MNVTGRKQKEPWPTAITPRGGRRYDDSPRSLPIISRRRNVSGAQWRPGHPLLRRQRAGLTFRRTNSLVRRYSVTINGVAHRVEVRSDVTLLDLLREQLHLTGAKKGCNRGECGACTVMLDGRRVNSCFVLAATLKGRRVTTVEGLATGDSLHPVQRAFIKCDAFQCGFCASGQICLRSVALKRGTRVPMWKSGGG